jgi:hypothetical protein
MQNTNSWHHNLPSAVFVSGNTSESSVDWFSKCHCLVDLFKMVVMATRDGGRVTAILYSRLATRLRSLAIILPIHLFTITRVHICNRIPIITIRMPMKPNSGVRALTRRCTITRCSTCHYSIVIPPRLYTNLIGATPSHCWQFGGVGSRLHSRLQTTLPGFTLYSPVG